MNPEIPGRADATGFSRWAHVSERLGIASLLLFAASIAPSPTGIFLGLFGMLAAAIAEFPSFWPWLRGHALFWLALAFAAWLWLRGFSNAPFDIPYHRANDAVHGLLRITGLPALIVGWWLIRLRDRLLLVFGVVVAGIALNVLVQVDWNDLSKYVSGFRPTFGMRGNGPSTFGAVLVIGCLTVARRVISGPLQVSLHGILQRLAWGIALLLGVFLLLVGQSRSVWLAMLAVSGLALIACLAYAGPSAPIRLARENPWKVGASVMVIVLAGVVFGSMILERILREPETWTALLALDFDRVASTSIGFRVAQWQIALETVAAHPLAGIGPGGAEAAMAAAAHPVLGDRTFPHFHNLYLEIAATIGLPGLVLFLAVLGCLAWCTWSGLRSSRGFIRDLSIFVLVSGLMMALVSLFQIRHDDPHGMALIVFLSACAVAAASRCRESPGTEVNTLPADAGYRQPRS